MNAEEERQIQKYLYLGSPRREFGIPKLYESLFYFLLFYGILRNNRTVRSNVIYNIAYIILLWFRIMIYKSKKHRTVSEANLLPASHLMFSVTLRFDVYSDAINLLFIFPRCKLLRGTEGLPGRCHVSFLLRDLQYERHSHASAPGIQFGALYFYRIMPRNL